jgi:hypothetical protein
MSVSNASVAQSQPSGKEDARVPGEIEMSMFSLRDTLSGITVREANFSEFLAVLKKCGVKAAKPN